MAATPPSGEKIYDSLFSFEQGMNAGIAAPLLPKNQLAFGTNTTVRGALVGPRPYYRKMLLDFVGGGDIQPASTQSLFQGVGYYKPDAGLECLMTAVAGRMFQFQVDGPNAHVSEVTTAALRQDSGVSQCWLWQSERWMIFNDGISLPLFFDGANIRRSLGNSTYVAGTTSGFARVTPGLGLTIPMLGPYTGPFPASFTIGGFKYTATSQSTAGASAFTITGSSSYSRSAGSVLGANTKILSPSGFFAVTTTDLQSNFSVQTVGLSAPYTGQITNNQTLSPQLTIGGGRFNIISISNGGLTIQVQVTGGAPVNVLAPQNAQITGQTITFATVGVLSSALTIPASGASFTANLAAQFTYPLNGYYIIGTASNFTAVITAVGTSSSTVYNLTAVNVNDNSGGSVANGTTLIVSGQELPAGRMGIYAAFRNWICLTDGISFVAGDQVGDSSGTVTYNFRDAVLEMTQNDFLLGGGSFRVPTSGEQIQAIAEIPTLDTTLNGGPIAVLTPNTAFACQSPVDRTTWQDLTNPILSVSMIDAGAEGQDSTVCANSDLLFRSSVGSRSLILARRDFNTWGNVPISHEIYTVLAADDKSLLPYGSAITFDNRKLETANPITSSLGVYHTKITALNFDPISSLAGKAPSVYDGIWQDLNVLKLIKGRFAGVERAFAFCLSQDLSTIELWEILPSADPATQDSDGAVTVDFECPVIYRESDLRARRFKRLINGEIFVDQLIGKVDFQVFYRPDDYPSWIPWYEWSEEAKLDDPTDEVPQFRPRMGLGEPSGTPCDTVTNRPFREGYYFQVRVVMTGHCRFKGARFMAVTIPEPEFAPPKSS